MNYDQEQLEYVLTVATNNKGYCQQPTVDNAKELFGKIKEVEKSTDEFEEAKYDLKEIFGLTDEDIKSMTKNHLYLEHQSRMINAIISLFMRKELAK